MKGNPTSSVALIFTSATTGIVCYHDRIFKIIFNFHILISQIDHLSFCRRAALCASNQQIASYSSIGVVKTAVVFMSTIPFLSLMLYSAFCCIQFVSKMFIIEYDFGLTNFRFLRCNLVFSNLVESKECFPSLRRSQSESLRFLATWSASGTKVWATSEQNTRIWKRKSIMAEHFSGSSISGILLRGNNYLRKKIASSRDFPAQVLSSGEKLLKNAVISNRRFVCTNTKRG